MKKYILLLCALCAGLVSCIKEDYAGAEADGQVTFTASYEPQTKTVLNGLTPYWTASEKIAIFNGVNNEFTATVTEPSATATFKGELAGKGTKNFRAVSPYSADYTYSSLGSTFYGLSVPQEQTAVENSYDPQALVAIAQSDDYTLSFKNLGSLVKFTVTSEGVTSVTLRSNNEEVLSGSFEATYSASPSVSVKEGKDEVTIKGDFKKGSTYYIVTLPASLEKGFIAILNGSVKALSIDAPVQLARSGMVNLGELSLNPGESQIPDSGEEDEAVASDWILLGEHNEWKADNGTPMYEVGSNFVAFDVPASAAAGFKFKNGDTWIGTKETVALNQWVKAQGEGGDNIMFTASSDALYDIYLVNSLDAFYITEAGSPAPTPAPKPFVGMAVAGTFNSWSTSSHPAAEEGDYYVLRGFKAAMASLVDAGDKGFKFVCSEKDGSQIWYGTSSATVAVSKWYNTNSDGAAANIYVSGDAAADYDVYMTKDRSRFCVVPTGESLPSEDVTPDPTPEPDAAKLYLKPNANWKVDGARFAAYFFGNGEKWVSMTDADGDGYYECEAPSGFPSVIFCRMNPGAAANSWDNKWNQTSDLTVPVDGTNCYTVKEGTWDYGGGTWSIYR